MKKIVNQLHLLFFSLCLTGAATAWADGTNPPPVDKDAWLAGVGPLSGLMASMLKNQEVNRLDPKLGLILGVIAPVDTNRVILIPDRTAQDATDVVTWLEEIRCIDRPRLIMAHSEVTPDGVALNVYLTSSSGVLEKAVRRVNGGEFTLVPLADASAGFKKQVDFWLADLAKSHPQ
jgi:hypothetical protein